MPTKSIFHSSYLRTTFQKDIVNITTIHDFTYEHFEKGISQIVHSWQKKLAIENGVKWDNSWVDGDSILWENMNEATASQIKKISKDFQNSCQVRVAPKKHKYLYILGENKKETKELRMVFAKLNPKLINLAYPKERGKY